MRFFSFDEKTNVFKLERQDLLLVECFDTLLNNDKTKTKSKFWSYCKYLYFVYDNDNFMIKSKKKLDFRKTKGLEYSGLKQDDLKDKTFITCEQEFIYWNYTTSMQIRDGNIITMDNIDKYSREANLTDVDKKGELLHDINKIATARKNLVQMAKDTKDLESLIEIELEEKGKARGGKLTTPIESGQFDSFIRQIITGEKE